MKVGASVPKPLTAASPHSSRATTATVTPPLGTFKLQEHWFEGLRVPGVDKDVMALTIQPDSSSPAGFRARFDFGPQAKLYGLPSGGPFQLALNPTEDEKRPPLGAINLKNLRGYFSYYNRPIDVQELTNPSAGTYGVKWSWDRDSTRPNDPVFPATHSNVKDLRDLAKRMIADFDKVYPEFIGARLNRKSLNALVHGTDLISTVSGSILQVQRAGKPLRDIDVGFPIKAVLPMYNISALLEGGPPDLNYRVRVPSCAVVAGFVPGDPVKQLKFVMVDVENGKILGSRLERVPNERTTLVATKLLPKIVVPKPPEPPKPTLPEPRPPTASTPEERARYERERAAYDQAWSKYREAFAAYEDSPEYQAWEEWQRNPPPRVKDPKVPPIEISLEPYRVVFGNFKTDGRVDWRSMGFDYSIETEPADQAEKLRAIREKWGDENVHVQAYSHNHVPDRLLRHTHAFLDFDKPLSTVAVELPFPEFPIE